MYRCITLAAMLLVVGCSKTPDHPAKGTENKKPAPVAKEDGVSWLFAEPNDQYHMRLSVDVDKKKLTAKLLDESAKAPVAIGEESVTLVVKEGKGVQIVLKADAAKGKKADTFAAEHDRFAAKLDPKTLEITATVEGKNFVFRLDDHKH